MHKIEQAIRETYRDKFLSNDSFEEWLENTTFTINFGKEKVFNLNYSDSGFFKDLECMKIEIKNKNTDPTHVVHIPEYKKREYINIESDKNNKYNFNQKNKSLYGRKCYVVDYCVPNEYETENEFPAIFHSWGVEYETYNGIPAPYSVGIVEFENGEIKTIIPSYIRFEDDDNE